ncbi:MAG TPA: GrpB family protein [Candidatus Cybelea sp.]
MERCPRPAARIARALGPRALRIEHVDSTAVPGLAAKPTIDILLEVSDSSDEASYVPALESAGYVPRIRARAASHECEDRELYEHTKRALAQRQWTYVQNYADAKSEVVESILARTPGAVPSKPHEMPDAC